MIQVKTDSDIEAVTKTMIFSGQVSQLVRVLRVVHKVLGGKVIFGGRGIGFLPQASICMEIIHP